MSELTPLPDEELRLYRRVCSPGWVSTDNAPCISIDRLLATLDERDGEIREAVLSATAALGAKDEEIAALKKEAVEIIRRAQSKQACDIAWEDKARAFVARYREEM